MSVFESLQLGFATALLPQNLLFCLIGVTLGTVVGLIPGLGALTAISILLPVTYYLDPATAIIMLAGIYYGAQYGGSTASILMNMPGTPTHAVTCLDGYPMAKQGRAGPALFITTISSFVGGCAAITLMMFLGPMVAELALRFQSAEYFAVMLFGLVAASTLSTGSPLKGLAMVVLGVGLGFIGRDITTGVARFTFGFPQLSDGLSLAALAMGMFGVAEILNNMSQRALEPFKVGSVKLRSLLPSRREMRQSTAPTLRGTAIGSVAGILPGVGPTIAAFMAYAVEKRVSSEPERFGNGAVEGVAAPEAANNAAVQSAFIPTLSLGVPGDAVGAILLAALMLHGIAPGPGLVLDQAPVFWGLIASFWIGNVLLLILNIPLIGVWVSILRIPYDYLYPAMLLFICIGVYSINFSTFDVLVVVIAGLAGFVLMNFGFPAAPLLLGFILGPMIEENLRRAMMVSRGNPEIFINSPISFTFLSLTLAVLVMTGLRVWRTRRGRRLS
jgi:putative tricarboxylic transport membrane protein